MKTESRVADLESELRELNATKTDRGMVVTLGDVLFDSGQSRLSAGGTRNMARLAAFFERCPQRSATIEGTPTALVKTARICCCPSGREFRADRADGLGRARHRIA